MSLIPVIFIILWILVIRSKAKDIKKDLNKVQSKPMSYEQQKFINDHNAKELERVRQAAEKREREMEYKPIQQTSIKKSSEYDLSKSNPSSVGRSKQKDALNIKTSAKGVNVGASELSISRIQLRREMEDRSNDWLAKQLRYEKSALRNNGLDLGYSHDVDCDADDLKRAHRDDCEDKWVDDGEF